MNTPGDEPKPGGFGGKWSTGVSPFLTLGLQLAISVVAFFFFGRWLDAKFGTAPWLMYAGLLIGMAGGFISFFRSVIALGKKEQREVRKEPDHPTHED